MKLYVKGIEIEPVTTWNIGSIGVEFCGTLSNETEKSYMIHDGISIMWIPKSQVISCRCIRNDDYEFTVTEWIAKEKGII